MDKEYSASFFRGISSLGFYEDGFLLDFAFQTDKGRDDGYEEISITWNDDEDAFNLIASQINERTGKIQFPVGIAEIIKSEFDYRMKPQIINKNLGYERRPTLSNPYHGNILIKEDLGKHIKNLILAQVALIAQNRIHPNPFVESEQ